MKQEDLFSQEDFPWKDEDEIPGEIYPWEDVSKSITNKGLQKEHPPEEDIKYKYLTKAKPCPICKKPPEQLAWFYFLSPQYTWAHLCGVAGWITICDRCHYQVDFFTEICS